MNKARLVIKNFGPIKSVDLELGKMTILIGEQATGKSTVGKVLALCRFFSYIVNYSIDNESLDKFSESDQFMNGLREWGIDSYLNGYSKITYENDLYEFEMQAKLKPLLKRNWTGIGVQSSLSTFSISTETKIRAKYDSFTNLLNQLNELKKTEENSSSFPQTDNWSPNENFYRLNVKKTMDNPLYIPTERGLQGNNILIAKALEYEVIKINRIIKGYNNEVNIEPLSLKFKNLNGEGYVKKENSNDFYALNNGASGYQSTIPIVLALKYYNEIEKRQRTFVVEEPELNLFPSAQKKLVEFLVESTNRFRNNRFLLPTHSPYIVSSLNNLMVAFRVGQKHNQKVNDIIEEKYWINPKEVRAYCLVFDENEKGVIAKNLILDDLQEISIDYLDGISSEINQTWDKLLQVEDES
jgi:predicted ATPase